MQEEKKIIHDIETEFQNRNTNTTPSPGEHGEIQEHHSKRHVKIIILITVLLVAILVIIALFFRKSQEPEDVLQRLEAVSAPVTMTPEEMAAEMEALAETRSTPAPESLPPEERAQRLEDRQSELEALGSL